MSLLNLKDISENDINKEIYVYGRIHKIRPMNNKCFIILRDQIWSIQCIITKSNPDFKKICKITAESYIKAKGIISKLPENVKCIEYTSHKNFEINLSDIEIISKSTNIYPFILEDVDKRRNTVLIHTRFDNRSFDLRAPFNNCIFKIQSGIGQLFREYLLKENFMEIHSPRIIKSASEGGAEVFKINYFNLNTYLAQSPQLYKQMCINSDFNRVFEIGPVFRAENSMTHRHLCEFISLDLEMVFFETYYEIINMAWNTLRHIFENIEINCKDQIKYIKSIYNYPDIIFPILPLIIDFREGVKILKEAGYEQNELDDLNSQNEKALGDLIKQKYNSDLFVLNKYPLKARPFYTMPFKEDSLYSNSFDIILRGQEISSGSERIHDLHILLDRMSELKLDLSKFTDYLQSFCYGSKYHGGCGFGLERLVMLYLNLENIRETSLYPRDPHRVTP